MSIGKSFINDEYLERLCHEPISKTDYKILYHRWIQLQPIIDIDKMLNKMLSDRKIKANEEKVNEFMGSDDYEQIRVIQDEYTNWVKEHKQQLDEYSRVVYILSRFL